jgi:hypothetical protein
MHTEQIDIDVVTSVRETEDVPFRMVVWTLAPAQVPQKVRISFSFPLFQTCDVAKLLSNTVMVPARPNASINVTC